METKHIYLKDLHFEHKVWLNELKFYKDEITIFEHRLEEVVSKNTGQDVLAKLESFQNQFIREREVVDELSHKIKLSESAKAKYAQEHPIAIDHHYFEDHTDLRDEMNRFRELFAELKSAFLKFLAEWM